MSARARFLWILAASPLVILAINAAAVRLRLSKRGPQSLAFRACLAGFPVVLACAWASYLDRLRGPSLAYALVYAASVYWCLAYFYFHLFNLTETSRRFRLLCELRQAGPLDRSHLERLYSAQAQVEARLDRLLGMGQVELVDGRYRLKSRGLWLAARLVEGFRKVLGFRAII